MNYSRVLDDVFGQFAHIKFSVKLWDDSELFYGSGDKLAFTLILKNKRTLQRLLAGGSIGFGESYMSGDLEIDGDIEQYLGLRYKVKKIRPTPTLAAASLLAKHSMPRHRKDQIAQHYDLGNKFFELFLDKETMSYSCALYTKGSQTLASAQRQKIDAVCSWLQLKPGAKVLDLGFGWGGFIKQATEKYMCDVTGQTLSKAQLNYTKKRIPKTNHRTKLIYKDMVSSLPQSTYDAITMVESIEHVGQRRLQTYFNELYERLSPGGRLYIQSTARYTPRRVDRWTLKYVFPGGYLPTITELVEYSAKAGFRVEFIRDDTADYIRTIDSWIKSIEKNKHHITEMFDSSHYNLWHLWTHGAKVAFENDSMSLFRILLSRPE